MRVLVVGASGFIGHHVVEQLRVRNHAVTRVARTPRPGIDHTLDATAAAVVDWIPLLEGHDGVVFAAGADIRATRRGSAAETFHRENVEPVVRLLTAARLQGITRAVVIGSYYTYFDREHPRWNLAATHPYIRSRVEQARAGREAAGWSLPVTVLELPFVFGRVGDTLPNWAGPLASWARSRSPLVAPDGGTAVTTGAGVGWAAATALEQALGGDIPVVDDNLTWHEMFSRIAAATGRPRPVRRLPSTVVRGGLRLAGLTQALTGKESGLRMGAFGQLLLRELFIPPVMPRPIDAAITETFGRPQAQARTPA